MECDISTYLSDLRIAVLPFLVLFPFWLSSLLLFLLPLSLAVLDPFALPLLLLLLLF